MLSPGPSDDAFQRRHGTRHPRRGNDDSQSVFDLIGAGRSLRDRFARGQLAFAHGFGPKRSLAHRIRRQADHVPSLKARVSAQGHVSAEFFQGDPTHQNLLVPLISAIRGLPFNRLDDCGLDSGAPAHGHKAAVGPRTAFLLD
jgi:hypothetical protein